MAEAVVYLTALSHIEFCAVLLGPCAILWQPRVLLVVLIKGDGLRKGKTHYEDFKERQREIDHSMCFT